MAFGREPTERRLDVVPAPFVVEAAPDEFTDERAPLARADPAVELGHELVVQRYVHTHVPNLAHRPWLAAKIHHCDRRNRQDAGVLEEPE